MTRRIEACYRTEAGPSIRAGAVLFATNSPVNDMVKIHTKQIPMRTYAMAGRVPAGSVEDALIWDTLGPTIMFASSRPATAPTG